MHAKGRRWSTESNHSGCLNGVLKEEEEIPREIEGSEGKLPGGSGY